MEYQQDAAKPYKSTQALRASRLSNVELMLLELVSEQGEASGYDIDRLVKARGYRIWAGIGTTSIYVGLEKLRKKQLVDFYLHTKKQGKGPIPKRFKLTPEGRGALRSELLSTLSSARERDQRFDLALAGLPLLKVTEATKALEQRKEFLLEVAKEISERFNAEGSYDFALHTRIIFTHLLFLIKHELTFTDSIISGLR